MARDSRKEGKMEILNTLEDYKYITQDGEVFRVGKNYFKRIVC